MAETVALTTPITYPSVTAFGLTKVTIDLVARSVYIEWSSNTSEKFSANYPTPVPPDHLSQPTGNALIHTINTTNFTVTSLAKRLYQQLQSDGYMGAGAIQGSPE